MTLSDGPGGLPYRSKTDLVTDYLRAELQAGRPGAGQRLIVSRVADHLGVSKIPVREAVTRLIGEGLLILRPNAGPVVPTFTAHEVIETALMRVALETISLADAVPRHTPESLGTLDALLAKMETGDEDFPALNVEFHRAVILPSSYAEMVKTINALLQRAQRYAAVRAVPDYQAQAHHEHREIYDCLVRADVETLVRLNQEHVMRAAHKLTETMASAPIGPPDS